MIIMNSLAGDWRSFVSGGNKEALSQAAPEVKPSATTPEPVKEESSSEEQLVKIRALIQGETPKLARVEATSTQEETPNLVAEQRRLIGNLKEQKNNLGKDSQLDSASKQEIKQILLSARELPSKPDAHTGAGWLQTLDRKLEKVFSAENKKQASKQQAIDLAIKN